MMTALPRRTVWIASLSAAAIAVALRGAAAQAAHPPKILAQVLVDAAQAKHPEASEIGILATTAKGCVGIASTDRSDVGEKCEAEDIVPLRTGKPSVGKEGGGFDVSVPLRDTADKVVGVLVVGFKPAAGQTRASVSDQATAIAAEMAARIPSKAKLLK